MASKLHHVHESCKSSLVASTPRYISRAVKAPKWLARHVYQKDCQMASTPHHISKNCQSSSDYSHVGLGPTRRSATPDYCHAGPLWPASDAHYYCLLAATSVNRPHQQGGDAWLLLTSCATLCHSCACCWLEKLATQCILNAPSDFYATRSGALMTCSTCPWYVHNPGGAHASRLSRYAGCS